MKFEFNDNFIYSLTNNRRRFCIPNTCEQTMFVIIYNENQHAKRY